MVLMFVAGSLLLMVSTGNEDAVGAPTRGVLYGHTESFNLTFSKPTFYGDKDPHNNNKYVGNNTWDDIAFVIFFQDQHTDTTSAGGNTVNIADIYQALYVNLSGDSFVSGTDETILMEDFTATWCGFCTSIIGSMERLDHDSDWFPEKYVGVQFHISGTYGNNIGPSRKNYYCSSSGIPTWVIDGVDATIGGGTSPNNSATDSSIKGKINNRIGTSAFNITAKAGHTSTQAWVDFSFKIEDQNFDNKLVDLNVLMVQDAFPRRHGTNSDAYLGLIAESMQSPTIFSGVQGSNPVISNIAPTDGTILSGTVDVTFDVTDADADDAKIISTVEVKAVGGLDWAKLTKSGGVYKWNTAAKSGEDNLYPDGDYEIRISSSDYWEEVGTETIQVSVLNPDIPTIALNDQQIQDQLDDGMIEGGLDIIWMAEDDEDGSDLSIDLYYMRPGMEWTVIAEDQLNAGVYTWDTSDPRIPDNDRYRVMVKATDSDNMTVEMAGAFDFEINNPDPPTLELISPREGQELSGKPSIRWTAQDDEDSQTKLSVDIFISQDEGLTYTPVVAGVSNTGSYIFDTSYYDDGEGYKVKVAVKDSTDRSTEVESGVFSIYNNDLPGCRIVSPSEEEMVTDTITVEWSSNDQEDEPEDMTFSLYYMFSGGTYWKELATDEPNTGTFPLDTLDFDEGDGVYTLRLIVTDSRGELSDASQVLFTVYNPDTPEVISASGPTAPVEKAASFTWYAEDDDPYETDGLKVWFYYSTNGEIWNTLEEGMANTGSYTMDVTGLDDGTYSVKMVIADCQPGEFNRTVEHLFMDITVDNNDAPTIEMTSSPDPSIEHEDTVSASWSGSDAEGDKLYYTAYYRPVGDSGWTTVPGAFRITSTSLNWDISTLPAGDYELKIVVVEDTRDSFESEVITTAFTVKEKAGVIIDDDDDDDIITPQDNGDESNLGLILGIVIAVIVLIIIGLLIGGLLIMNKRKTAANQLPPPGGLPQQSQTTGLPGQVDVGQLAAAPATQPGLPPAPGPQEPELAPAQPEAAAPVPEEAPAVPEQAPVAPTPEPQPAPAPAPEVPPQAPPTV